MAIIIDENNNKVGDTTSTTTATVEECEVLKEDEHLFIQTPIFILFGEYLGYVSSFIEHAENWCNPSKPMPTQFMQTFLEREARSIYDDMLADFSEDEINKLYKTYYLCGLDALDEDLKAKRKKNGDDLPF